MKRKIIYALSALFLLFLAINHRWVWYLFHLARHQVQVIIYKEKISDRLRRNDLSTEHRHLLETTLKIRGFIEKEYQMSNSRSYASYFDLGRKALGFNITLAPRLSLKPESFNFFPIGKFDYLGFFDPDLAEKWAVDYRKRGFDVHLAEIGGYSTLGWFEDPLYSNQINWGEYGLARLLGHEIAHEKLYINGDTTFSELLAAFIEKKIAADYLKAQGRKLPTAAEMDARRKLRDAFISLVLETKTNLEKLYASPVSDAEKLGRKKTILDNLKATLKNKALGFNRLPEAVQFLESPEINNATLIQFHRYTPQTSAFDRTFTDCIKSENSSRYNCWFAKIRELEKATPAARQKWLQE